MPFVSFPTPSSSPTPVAGPESEPLLLLSPPWAIPAPAPARLRLARDPSAEVCPTAHTSAPIPPNRRVPGAV